MGQIGGEPHPRLGVLGENPPPVGDHRSHDDRVPLAPRDTDAIAAQHLHDDGIAVGPEVARVLVALAHLERHGADPIEEGGVVERVLHRGEGRIAVPGFAVIARVGIDLEVARPLAAALVGVLVVVSGAEIGPAHPGLERLIEMVPERAADDAEHEVHRFRPAHRVGARHFHRRRADVEDPVFRLIEEALPDAERDGVRRGRCGRDAVAVGVSTGVHPA